MGAAYSSLGQTKVLYATSFVLFGAKAKFLRRKPSVLVALEEISEMCCPQSILLHLYTVYTNWRRSHEKMLYLYEH